MNLPVNTHIQRLIDLTTQIQKDTEVIEKDLHILRGNITQISYINKESDRELNEFLVDSIGRLRASTEVQWQQN